MEQMALQLFEDYRHYRDLTASVRKLKQTNPYVRNLKATPERLALFLQLAKWCDNRKLPPRQWLYSLFYSRRWLFPPKLEVAHLMSDKHIQKYKTLSDYGILRKYFQEEQAIKDLDSVSGFDPNRDISHAAEDIKRAYRDAPRICMDKLVAETFGYHPKSGWCETCVIREECKQRLISSVAFDILALRRGEITSAQARTQAQLKALSYGK